jgi:hypothetical protein
MTNLPLFVLYKKIYCLSTAFLRLFYEKVTCRILRLSKNSRSASAADDLCSLLALCPHIFRAEGDTKSIVTLKGEPIMNNDIRCATCGDKLEGREVMTCAHCGTMQCEACANATGGICPNCCDGMQYTH